MVARDLIQNEDLPPWRLAVVHNGITLDGAPAVAKLGERARAARRALAGDRLEALVGTVGRLEGRKGLDVFLAALALLLDRKSVV